MLRARTQIAILQSLRKKFLSGLSIRESYFLPDGISWVALWHMWLKLLPCLCVMTVRKLRGSMPADITTLQGALHIPATVLLSPAFIKAAGSSSVPGTLLIRTANLLSLSLGQAAPECPPSARRHTRYCPGHKSRSSYPQEACRPAEECTINKLYVYI